MTEYQYVCRGCGREIDVDESTREAILQNGCPICAAPVQASQFAQER